MYKEHSHLGLFEGTLLLMHANNKGASHTALRLRSMICAFVIHFLKSIMAYLAKQLPQSAELRALPNIVYVTI